MSTPNVVKRGRSAPLGNLTQNISARLCGKFKHLSYGRLFTEWKQIFPDEVGMLYHPLKLTQNKLLVKTSSTQAALLVYFAPNMVERINQYLGGDIVVSIQAQQGTPTPNAKKLHLKPLAPLSQENKQHLIDVAQPRLKEALEHLGQWLEMREKKI